MQRSLRLLVPTLSLLGLVACKDPARNTAQAVTTAPTTAAASPASPRTGTQRLAINAATSSVGFVGAKLSAQHEGRFTQFTGNIDLDADRVENSTVSVDIDMNSVQIDPDRLLNHLRSPDFFNVAQFPHATFVSTSIVSGGAGGATHTITGNLSLHGQTRSVTFPATIHVSPSEATATSEFSINRRDFGIVYPGMPDDLIRDNVVIRLNLRVPRT